MKSPPRVIAAFCLAPAWAAPALADCSLTKVTQMPLLSLGKHYAVMVGIEDVVRPMMVDTGAEATTLKASVAKELSLKEDPAHGGVVAGVGQTGGDFHRNVIPSTLAFGDLVYHGRSTVVATMDDGKTAEGDSIGLLGDDILSQFDVEFDFPSHMLTFYRASGCFSTFLPWSGPFAAIPFSHRGAKVTIDMILNQERTPTMVDTGNNLTFVSQDASVLWGARESDIAPTKGQSKSPLNNAGAMPVGRVTFEKVKIGADLFTDKDMGVIDVDMPHASANLGLDYWSPRKLWISYPHQWLFVANDPASVKLSYPVVIGSSAPPEPSAPPPPKPKRQARPASAQRRAEPPQSAPAPPSPALASAVRPSR